MNAAPNTRWSLTLSTLLLLSLPVTLLLAHAAEYMPFVADDALISLRYADRLLAGEGLNWTAGAPVEGYSNLLWILLDAALGVLGVDLIDGARLLGMASTVGVLWAMGRLHGGGGLPGLLAIWVAGAAFVLCGPVAIWAIGGLEQPLVAFLLAWGVVRWGSISATTTLREAISAGIPLGLLCLTRPDGALLAGLFGLTLVILDRGRKRAWRQAVGLGLWPVGLTLAQLIFRLAYYDDWVPNTAHLKASWTSVRFWEGVDYIIAGLEGCAPLALLSTLGIYAAICGHRRREAVLLVVVSVVWLGYVASVGGDIFPAHRHLLPALACFALLSASGIRWLTTDLAPKHVGAWGLMSVALLYGHYALQGHDFANKRAKMERWEWDGLTIGPMLRAAIGDRDPLLAVTAAGALPYFSGFRSLDMQGLNDRHIAQQPPQKGAWLAHDRGDGKYVLDQKPDLMVFGGVIGGPPKFVSGSQMYRDKRLKRHYRMITLEGFDPHRAVSRPWVRLDGALGLQISPDRVEVPGHFFSESVGQPLSDGRLGARFTEDTPAESLHVQLSPGPWQVEIMPPEANLQVEIVNVGDQPAQAVAGPKGGIQIAKTQRVQLRLTARRADTVVSSIALVKRSFGGQRRSLAPKASVTLHTPKLTPRTMVKVIGSFKEGLDGWHVSGDAFERNPHHGPKGKYSKRQKGMKGYTGPMLNTYHGEDGDEARGWASSPTFTPEQGQILEFRIGGGDNRVELQLLDVADGIERPVMAWTGPRSEALETRRYDLSLHAGRTLRLKLVDDADLGWGHITLDEVQILR